jgi:hypothetical protein
MTFGRIHALPLILAISIPAISILFSGCQSAPKKSQDIAKNPTVDAFSKQQVSPDQLIKEKKLEAGFTYEQVTAAWGEPSHKQKKIDESNTEIWFYTRLIKKFVYVLKDKKNPKTGKWEYVEEREEYLDEAVSRRAEFENGLLKVWYIYPAVLLLDAKPGDPVSPADFSEDQ